MPTLKLGSTTAITESSGALTIANAAIGTPTSGVLTNLTGLVEGAMPSKSVISATSFTDDTRRALSNAGEYWLTYGTVVKKSATSKLVCTESTSGHADHSGNCGVGVRIGNVYRYGAFQYTASANQKQYSQIHDFGDMGGAGSFTVYWGWKTYNNDVGSKPFAILNGNNTDDVRSQQTSTSIIVWEVQA
jgi:hypothetical protein